MDWIMIASCPKFRVKLRCISWPRIFYSVPGKCAPDRIITTFLLLIDKERFFTGRENY